MQDFDLIRPENIAESCNLLASMGNKARVIAGGTDLMIDLRKHKLPAGTTMLLDISSLAELNYIIEEGEFIRIGAGVTHAQLAASKLLKEKALVLAEAALALGSPQIRNRGTIGGNIVAAAPCADTAPPLVVLQAIVVLRKGNDQREVAIESFFKGPFQVNIAPNELLSEIYFKKLPRDSKSAFVRLARRNALAKSRMSLAVAARLNDEHKIEEIRISAGSVTPLPCRFKAAEAVLLGKIPAEEDLKEAAELISGEMIERSGFRWSTDYKKPVVEVLAVRALKRVMGV